MGLLDDRHPVALQALDEPQLPERPAAVEHLALQTRHQRLELLLVAGMGQGGEADVVGEVEGVVVDPDRPALLEGHRHEPLAEARDEVEPAPDDRSRLVDAEPAALVEERPAFEHRERAHVHRRLGSLHVEERRVLAAQSVVHEDLPQQSPPRCYDRTP